MLERSKFYDSLAESRLRSKFVSEVTFGVLSYLKIIIRGLQQTLRDKNYHQPRGALQNSLEVAVPFLEPEFLQVCSCYCCFLFCCCCCLFVFQGLGAWFPNLIASRWCLISTPASALHPLLCILPVETITLQWEPCFSSWFSTQLSLSFYCSLGS